jgi:protein TonB
LIVEKNHYRIISAGSDRTFSPMTWERPAAADTAEDLIFEDGAFVRQPDANALFAGKALTVKPIAQPLDPARRDRSGIARSGGDVEAPSVLERPEPSYPEYYRQLRLSGIVILECVIAANGSVDDVRVVKSLAPDFDMAAADAVRRWKFSPAMQDGRAIPVLFNLTINFKLR